MTSTETISESELAQTLGISRGELKRLRESLVEGEHYKRTPEIVFLASGIDLILEKINAGASAVQVPALAKLTILQQVLNPRLVLAQHGNLRVRVKVPHTAKGNHFRAGDIIQARHVEGDLWAYHGPAPRFPGDPLAVSKK